MFEHKDIDIYDFEDVPVGVDCYIMDESDMEEFEEFLFDMFEGKFEKTVGSVIIAAVNKVRPATIDFSWGPLRMDRFHSIPASLPKDQFVTCIESSNHDVKPRIFVKKEWLDNLCIRNYSVFCLIDAIDVKKMIHAGNL